MTMLYICIQNFRKQLYFFHLTFQKSQEFLLLRCRQLCLSDYQKLHRNEKGYIQTTRYYFSESNHLFISFFKDCTSLCIIKSATSMTTLRIPLKWSENNITGLYSQIRHFFIRLIYKLCPLGPFNINVN